MKTDNTKSLNKVIRIEESEIRGHLDDIVMGVAEGTVNALLDTTVHAMRSDMRAVGTESIPVLGTITDFGNHGQAKAMFDSFATGNGLHWFLMVPCSGKRLDPLLLRGKNKL